MNGMLMVKVKEKKNNLIIEKLGENLSIRFLRKKMKKLNNELGFMSNYLFRLRSKLNHKVRMDLQLSMSANEEISKPFTGYSMESIRTQGKVYL